MNEMNEKLNISSLLQKQFRPSLGCTEPASVGLAVAVARFAIDDKLPSWVEKPINDKTTNENKPIIIESVLVEVDRDVYKNSYSVGIPGTDGQAGIYFASILGLFCNPEKKLLLFNDSTNEKMDEVNKLVASGKIKIVVVDDWKSAAKLNIKATVNIKQGDELHKGVAIIKNDHTNVVFVAHNNNVLFESKNIEKTDSEFDNDMYLFSKLDLKEMISAVENLTQKDQDLIYDGIIMNQKAYQYGLDNVSGLGIGAKLQNLILNGKIKKDMSSQAKSKTAAAEDARMSGQDVTVMGTAGSGSHGLAMSVPVIAVAEEVGWDKDKLIKAVALSNFITLYISYYSGYLSALCGCVVKSGVGASAGIAYYLGGGEKEVSSAIKNMTGDITGVICDGAKVGCAIKLATSAGSAVQNALLAIEGVEIPFDNGIVAKNAEETMKNIGKISKGMVPTDKTIIDIMDEK